MEVNLSKYKAMNEKQKFNAILVERKKIEKLEEDIEIRKAIIATLQKDLSHLFEVDESDEERVVVSNVTEKV